MDVFDVERGIPGAVPGKMVYFYEESRMIDQDIGILGNEVDKIEKSFRPGTDHALQIPAMLCAERKGLNLAWQLRNMAKEDKVQKNNAATAPAVACFRFSLAWRQMREIKELLTRARMVREMFRRDVDVEIRGLVKEADPEISYEDLSLSVESGTNFGSFLNIAKPELQDEAPTINRKRRELFTHADVIKTLKRSVEELSSVMESRERMLVELTAGASEEGKKSARSLKNFMAWSTREKGLTISTAILFVLLCIVTIVAIAT